MRVSTAVPGDAPSGGHYVNVVFRTGAKSSGAAGTGMSGEIGVPQLFTTRGNGPIVREAEVDRILPVLLEDGTIGFQVIVDNPGNVHYFPQGRPRVDCGGGPTETLAVPRSTAVVPGAERIVNVEGSLDIPSGAACDARVGLLYGGGRPATGSLTFTPDARLAVTELEATERPGSGPGFRLVLDNPGELLLTPGVRLDVFDSGGEALGSATPARPPSVEPGEAAEIAAEYPGRLGAGKYILRASAVHGAEIAEKQIDFRLGASAPEARPGAPVVENQSNLGPWVALGLIAFSILLVVLAIRYVPQLKPVRRRLGRAWEVLRESEK